MFEKKICGTQDESRIGYLKRQKGKGIMVERHIIRNEFLWKVGPEHDAHIACIKKSDKIAAWVVHHSGTESRHKMKDCFGYEG